MAKRRRGKKARRRVSPLTAARKIAAKLRGLGYHGRFTIEKFHVDFTEWMPDEGREFFWLKSAQPNWIEFRARFRHPIEIEGLDKASKAFLMPLIETGYTGRSIALVNTQIGEEMEEWRSLTVTNKARATLGQVGDATRRWMNKPEYIAATGIAIRIEIGG